jgi:hypothetical protein
MRRHLGAAAGAFLATLALCAGTTPDPLLETLEGNSLLAIAAFAALYAGGWWVLGTVPRSTFAWAVPFAALYAIADLAGISLLRDEADLALLRPSAWGLVHLLGTAYVAALVVAVLLHAIDRRRQGDGPQPPAPSGPLSRVVAALREGSGRARWRAALLVFAVIVVARLPYFIVWWPGLIFFDTYRSLSYARQMMPWDTYEPVGHSLLITGWNALWDLFGWSDATAMAFAATLQVLSSSAALAFLLVRVAAWGLGHRMWGALLAWLALVPALSLSSVTVVKDIPFMSAFVVFTVCVAELALALRRGASPRWAWVALFLSGVAVAVLRNNGVYVVMLGLVLLLLPLRRRWKPLLAVFAGTVLMWVLYTGPLFAALGVGPGPKTEAWSVPLQQIARISLDHHETMSDEDRAFVNSIFTWWQVDDVGEHYIPQFADPIKLDARAKWDDLSTGEFLTGWSRLVAEYPGSAVTATLANTVGYWAPGAPAYDGLFRVSWNDVRGITLDIPSEEPTDGVRGFLERHELLGDGLRDIPVLGVVMSPGTVTWIWLFAVLVLLRKRAWVELAPFVPAGALMLTFLAGPVSGGMRYSLGLYATAPVVIAVALVAGDRSRRRGEGDVERAPADAAGGDEARAARD